ncbi:MAG: right-handed parallel beta-helix repeat-containing protein, partial [Clostridia bacterium]|nr:right-handed parallel beta-helix repeat-containing protein [Clostridia bacterium]
MLFRFSSSAPVSVPERADLEPFSDDEKVSEWANEPLEWAVEAGLIKGTDGNRLAPEGDATREQFAAIIERYDGSFKLAYNEPVLFSHYTEPDYPLVDDADFYVSVNGDDSADGSFDHPFRTWERARDAVRTLDKTGRNGIKVAFFAGDYGPLSVTLDAEDSGTPECPITYCKYGDGDVIFDNGFTVTEDRFLPLSESEKGLFRSSAAGSIKKADVSGELADYDPAACLVMGEDRVCTLARFPNKYEDGSDHLFEGAAYNCDDEHIRVTMPTLISKLSSYRPEEKIYVYGYLTTGWSKDLLETDGFDPATGLLHVPHPETTTAGYLRRLPEFDSASWNQTALVNASEELDAAGEFWVDPVTKTLYMYKPAGDYMFAGGDGAMIAMDHADGVSFAGLTFRNSLRGILHAEHSHSLTLDGCSFSGCAAENAVMIKECDVGRPYDVAVSGCDFTHFAGAALNIEGDGDLEVKLSSGGGVTVDNNRFARVGLSYSAKGAVAVSTDGARIAHNVFEQCSWEAVDFRGAADLTVEYNVFDEVCRNGDDTGAIQNYSEIVNFGTVIRYNLFRGIRGGTNGRYCVYLDGSSGVEFYSNVLYCCDCCVMNNSLSKSNVIRGNVMINTESGVSAGARIHPDCTAFTEEAMAEGDVDRILNDGTYKRWISIFRYFEYRPSLKAKVNEMWPGYFDITTDVEKWNTAEFCLNSSVTITGNVDINHTGTYKDDYPENVRKYSIIENNAAYAADENPLFVNPSRGDYRVKDGAEFPDIQFEKIGRY